MNGLLRHTSNIHIGMWRNNKSFFGIIWNNMKSGYIFMVNGFSTARDGAIGLINNIRL
jgi:hypothetical protein